MIRDEYPKYLLQLIEKTISFSHVLGYASSKAMFVTPLLFPIFVSLEAFAKSVQLGLC